MLHVISFMRVLVTEGGWREGSVEIICSRLTARPAAVRAAAALVADAERRRANRFAFARQRRRFIVARARLRRLLGTRLGVRPEAVELVYGAQGKPALAGRFGGVDLRFNIAHSGDIVVYAFATGGEIGVDVEAVRAVPDSDAIAARFFSSSERAAYQALRPRERPMGFFNCWTRKEAFLKALGAGLSQPLDRFDVSLAPDEPARILRVGDTPGERCGWRLDSFSPARGFVGAVVTERK